MCDTLCRISVEHVLASRVCLWDLMEYWKSIGLGNIFCDLIASMTEMLERAWNVVSTLNDYPRKVTDPSIEHR